MEPEMIFSLYIRTGNDAFSDPYGPDELARILRQVADSVQENGPSPFASVTIRDVNGNDVGRYVTKPEERR